jgi:uncharacterized membrane protein
MNLRRTLRNLTATGASLRRAFDPAGLQAIERAIAEAERKNGGEIRFAVEGNLGALELMRGVTPRERALEAFAQLGVWDTEANNGVLIYLLWADHDVEIVADRGFNGRVSVAEWEQVCRKMEGLFATGRAVDAVIAGITAVSELIAMHYPAVDRNELPDKPVLL